jgi:hypothetical protein
MRAATQLKKLMIGPDWMSEAMSSLRGRSVRQRQSDHHKGAANHAREKH